MSNADIRGRFIWHELMTTDTDAAAAFYPKVLPWKTQSSGMPGYTLWYAGRTQAGGLMSLTAQSAAAGSAPHWLVYIGTPSVDSTAEAVQRLGGKVLKSPADIPGIGRFAVVSDPQGAGFALYTPAPGSADGVQPTAAGACSWHELATSDPQAALGFYMELFGWEKGPAHDMGGDMGIYQIVTHGGRQIGGIYRAAQASTPPSWLTYVQVADIDRAVSATRSGGGRVLNGPHQVPGGEWVAQVEDPQGGRFALLETEAAQISDSPAKHAVGGTTSAQAPKAAAAKASSSPPGPGASRRAGKPAAGARSQREPGTDSRPGAVTSGARTARKPAGRAAGKSARKAAGRSARKTARRTAGQSAGKAGRKAAGRAAGAVRRAGAKKAKKSALTRRASAGKKVTARSAGRRGTATAKPSGRAGSRTSVRGGRAKSRSGARARGRARPRGGRR